MTMWHDVLLITYFIGLVLVTDGELGLRSVYLLPLFHFG